MVMEKEMEEEERPKNKKLNIDRLFGCSKYEDEEDCPPPELVVVGRTTQYEQGPSGSSDMVDPRNVPDHQLNEKIASMRKTMEVSSKLPDKGAKLQIQLKQFVEEQQRRNQIKAQKKGDEWEKLTQSQNSHSPGGLCNGFVSDTPSSQAHPGSTFASHFSLRLEEKPDCGTHITANRFRPGPSYSNHGKQQNTRANGFFPNKQKRENNISSSQSPFRCLGAKRTIASSTFYNSHREEKLSESLMKRRKASGGQTSTRTKKNQTVDLVDEEDCHTIRTTQQEDETVESVEAKIYYPSRDDPESVELCYSDIKCLDPPAFLSSTIMNFYIRYLQRPVSPIRRSQSQFHFFNTYFYGKLKEAVSYKGNDKDTFFSKFRRWWKGVNIFEKAYIFLPIHETLHWSLVIICIPDKEDESGPIILHLDSLGFHISGQIFQNVKSFLREEWSYLMQKNIPTNVPIAERIWKHLPRRVEDKIIMVPQQKNDYDCGIFVLYFMERFIQEAPERLRKKQLDRFSRCWFKHEEAHGLRGRIRNLLREEFENARIENNNDSGESSPENDENGNKESSPEKDENGSKESSPPKNKNEFRSIESSPENKIDDGSRESSDTSYDDDPVVMWNISC